LLGYDDIVFAKLENVDNPREVCELISTLMLNSDEVLYANHFLISKDGTPLGITDRLLVQLRREEDFPTLEALVKDNAKIAKDDFDPLFYILTVNRNVNALTIANKLSENRGLFEFAEPDFLRIMKRKGLSTTTSIKQVEYKNPLTNDPHLNKQWFLNNDGKNTSNWSGVPNADMRVFKAWGITTGSPKIKIAIIDEGVDLNHPDLKGNLLPGYDAVRWRGMKLKSGTGGKAVFHDAHGTACAGIVAATGNNKIGTAGIAYSCKVIPVRIAFGDFGLKLVRIWQGYKKPKQLVHEQFYLCRRY
jgi:subtilisin family serine protease